MFRIGLDVGSTTLKCVVVDNNDKIVFKSYERHFSQISEKTKDLLVAISKEFENEKKFDIKISGSAGMGFSKRMDIAFVQEVFATRHAVKTLLPSTDVVIELGGEDAKILFLSGMLEVRMNGSCAGGTGAFIDQMATLLSIDPMEMNELSKKHEKIYSIASRCGVFAKTDIQPLLNQGAKKEDVSASIFNAVVNQTIAGLAQGRTIEGNVLYLGGPLTFFSELRNSFDTTLKLTGTAPENALYYVALGAALINEGSVFDINELIHKIDTLTHDETYACCDPLFANEEEYNDFQNRHKIGEIETKPLKGKAYIGVDAGSTTLKAVLIGEDEEIALYKYTQNNGTPVPIVKEFLKEVYEKFPNIEIAGFATTGYGEEIIKNAFYADMGIVETMAHFTAAKKYDPSVDFIIDIGGQDIKCFKIRNGAIDNIFLNEACSSGCGSFLQTFAEVLGKSTEEFSKLGLFANRPVDLGSRCTVFMNSSVKQAQKDGASIENISAGLSISVVKNAIYKVIRMSSPEALGKHIVVQGGTFLNDAVLRAFEKEVHTGVTRPDIAGLMGAFGAALYVKEHFKGESTVISSEDLDNFKHEVKATTCNLCANKCKLTVNIFKGGARFIGGNRCEKPLKMKKTSDTYNMYEYKKQLLSKYGSFDGDRETIGIPMVLNMFELLPFWHTFFKELGFGVSVTDYSTRELYLKGQHNIPSDTVCYPAKIVHGHVEQLLENGITSIFYPCMSYNFDEKKGDNHYNCPVVAYYPEVISANTPAVKQVKYIKDYLGIHRKKDFAKKIHAVLKSNYGELPLANVKIAAEKAYNEYDEFMQKLREKGEEYLKLGKEKELPIIVLAGRPYHLDPEISHGIDKLVCDCGAVLVTEDAVCHLADKFKTTVLNQWTYHSRLYTAAKYISKSKYKDINFVQLVSFGCGVDAITTDEIRKILERKSKIYTQIKIDEITNLGAVKIRLRSLFAATAKDDV